MDAAQSTTEMPAANDATDDAADDDATVKSDDDAANPDDTPSAQDLAEADAELRCIAEDEMPPRIDTDIATDNADMNRDVADSDEAAVPEASADAADSSLTEVRA